MHTLTLQNNVQKHCIHIYDVQRLSNIVRERALQSCCQWENEMGGSQTNPIFVFAQCEYQEFLVAFYDIKRFKIPIAKYISTF